MQNKEKSKKSLVQRFKEQHRATQAIIAGLGAGAITTGLMGGAYLYANRGKSPKPYKHKLPLHKDHNKPITLAEVNKNRAKRSVKEDYHRAMRIGEKESKKMVDAVKNDKSYTGRF